ncbi:unnamed protein product [Xylocopa violacea]|uniref:ATP synthase subunit d, mitochondrial n=1 Tax=Xylocopa violacea TaxID=135666 RepID=A0ABP1NKB0_XYLVO
MARRAIKAINWNALAERIPETEKASFLAFKSKSDKYLQRMMANPETAPQIDWAYYRKTITIPGLVDKFQKEYEALSIPYPKDKYTAAIDIEQQETVFCFPLYFFNILYLKFVCTNNVVVLLLQDKMIAEFIQQSDDYLVEVNASLSKIKNMIPFAEMTMDDYTEAFPTGFLRTDKDTTWPHTDDTQEIPDEEVPGHKEKSSH